VPKAVNQKCFLLSTLFPKSVRAGPGFSFALLHAWSTGSAAVDGYSPATRAPARAGDVKKENSTASSKFLGEVSQNGKIRV
jgi:hypothetical protein